MLAVITLYVGPLTIIRTFRAVLLIGSYRSFVNLKTDTSSPLVQQMSFIYGIVYLLFEAIPIVFGGEHGLNAGETGLIFLALLLGGVTAVVIYVFYFNKKYMATHRAMKPTPVPPEQRLKPLFYSAPALAIAFFWFAFTSYPSISIWSPIFAIWLLGVCILCEFLRHPRSFSLLVSNADPPLALR